MYNNHQMDRTKSQEVPDTVLAKLICDNCEGHLSRGPVLMLDNGKNRCGRCIKPKQGGQRNIVYEELASLLLFPCRYKEHGCQKMVKFTENQLHEESCAYRPFVWPIAESGKCEWSGIRDRLLEHSKTNHPKNVVQNPFKMLHDITKSSLDSFILSAFQVLFLIQTKVCVTSRTIYHSVRLIGDAKDISNYEFEISIENKSNKINKTGSVAPQGCMVLQEDTSVATSINSLLQVLGDFKDTTFTLTVHQKTENPYYSQPPVS